MSRVHIRIRRADRSFSDFHVTFDERSTILDALERIRTRQDPGLVYRHSCHHGSCGTCGVIANGKRVLACSTRVDGLEQPVTLEPLAPFPVIADLAVDTSSLVREFPEGASCVRESEIGTGVPPEEVPGYARFENCIECGLCESACPVVVGNRRKFKGPAALAAYNREIEKHPEAEEELLDEIDTAEGIWGCDRALQCSMVCPTGVYPAKHIADLMKRSRKRSGGSSA